MRVAVVVAVFALCAARGAASGEPPEPPAPPPSWAQPAIAVVVAHGLLAADVDSFRPDDPLTAGDLAALATDDPPDGGRPGRLPLRLGRHERGAAVALRRGGARRVRLLGVRLAGLQARRLPGRRGSRRDDPRPVDVRDERRGAAAPAHR